MKTVICSKIGNLKDPDPSKRGVVEVIDVPEPQIVDDETVKIKVAYCAICGSDPHSINGAFGPRVPIGMGHEISGVIVELGKNATKKGLKVGDKVAGNFVRPCGTCYYCRNGQEQFCRFAGEYNAPGMSEYIIWHEAQVFKLPEGLGLKKGCLLEPVSVVTRMADKTEVKIGNRVAISGGGPIGLLGLQLMKMYGATSLTLIEPIADRRELALKLGADYVIDPVNENLVDRAMEITGGLGYDVVVDVSGAPAAAAPLPKITALAGRIVYGAMYPTNYEMPFNLFNIFYHSEITVTGMFLSPYAFPRAAQLLPRLNLDAFVEKVFYIDDVKEAFDTQVQGKYPKILIHCNKDLID